MHLLPYALGVATLTVDIALRSPASYAALVESIFAGSPPVAMVVLNIAKVALGLVYLVLAARVAFGRALRPVGRARANWTRALAIASGLSLGSYAIVAIDPGRSAALAEGAEGPFVLVAAAMALLVYTTTVALIAAPEVPGCTDEHGAAGPHIPESECRRIADLVRAELDAGAYRNPQLSLGTLARTLDIHPNSLSAAVNHVYGTSFRKIVNRRRVEHFRTAAVSRDGRNILDVAFDAGFPSKSTFNRVFKEETGVTPSDYLHTIARGDTRT